MTLILINGLPARRFATDSAAREWLLGVFDYLGPRAICWIVGIGR